MKNENYLEKIPVRASSLSWNADEKGIVTIEKENTGIINRVFQRLIKKPKITYIHLDDLGSFVWLLTDGEKSIFDFASPVKEKFGEKAEPLFERLARYFQILEGYSFIEWKN